MLSFHSSFQYIQKSATYTAKSSQLLGGFAPQTPWLGALPLDPARGTAPRPPSSAPPMLAISPQTQGVWIKPCGLIEVYDERNLNNTIYQAAINSVEGKAEVEAEEGQLIRNS